MNVKRNREKHTCTSTALGAIATAALALLLCAGPAFAEPLEVCATVPDLGSLVRAVGGDDVSVTVFAKGTEDPHFVQALPSFIKALSTCDMYVQLGMEMEAGWAPLLLKNARNAKVLPGAPGYIDASVVVDPLQVPSVTIDRSMGDVHPFGNPHYTLDPIEGMKVAALLRDRLAQLRPSRSGNFQKRYDAFRERLANALVGETLAAKYDAEKLALLFQRGALASFLEGQDERAELGGWLGAMLPHYGTKAVGDHNMWPYFARRFGIDIVEHMEPMPGIPPTMKHLRDLVETMRAQNVGLILTSAYYDPRHARFLAEATGAKVAPIANQVGARPEADDYLNMMDYNVSRIVQALASSS